MGSSPSKSVEDLSPDDIATYVASLGNNFKPYESTIRTSGIRGNELLTLDDECLILVLDSMSITNRLHQRKLANVCRKQIQLQQSQNGVNHNHNNHNNPEWDTCSSSSCGSSVRTPASCPSILGVSLNSNHGGSNYQHQHQHQRRSLSPKRHSNASSTGSSPIRHRSLSPPSTMSPTTQGRPTSPMPPPPMIMPGALENMCVEQSAEALSLLVGMENEKRLLRKADRPSGPPTGKAAIVLTDVQGSTALWEADSKAMRQALNLHDEIIRELRAEHGGYEIDTEGDAFFLAFHTANDALGFALGLQTALREAPWGDDILALPDACDCSKTHNRGLRVRMGIHMGPVTTRHNAVTGRLEYTGPTMEKARHVEGMANGGEILASRSTWEAASIAAQVVDKSLNVVQVLCAQRRSACLRRGSLGGASVMSASSATGHGSHAATGGSISGKGLNKSSLMIPSGSFHRPTTTERRKKRHLAPKRSSSMPNEMAQSARKNKLYSNDAAATNGDKKNATWTVKKSQLK